MNIVQESDRWIRSSQRRKTAEQYKEELLQLRGESIRLQGEYLGARTPTEHICDRGHAWNAAPTNILKGRGCPYCSGRGKRTHKDYVEQVLRVHGDSIKVIGTYTINSVRIEHRCSNGHVFMGLPNLIKTGVGCPYCAGNAKKTDEEYRSELKAKYGDRIRSIAPYVNSGTAIAHICSEGHEFLSQPNVLLRDSSSFGCLQCSGRKKKTQEQYESDLLRVHKGVVTCIGTYINSKTFLKHKCDKGHKWEATPTAILMGRACPYCAGQRPDAEVRANRDLSKRVRARISNEMSRMRLEGFYKTTDSITLYIRDRVLSSEIISKDILEIHALYKQSRDLGLTVDHIIPLCFADVSKPEELAIVSCLGNLRLITKSANSRRSRNITKPEFFDPDLFTDWHIEAMQKLTYTRYYMPKFDAWVYKRVYEPFTAKKDARSIRVASVSDL